MKFRKTFSILLMLVLILAPIFFIGAESHHKCDGDDCPICLAIITINEQVLNNKISLKTIPVVLISCCLAFALFDLTENYGLNLFTQKVRLND